MDSQGQLSIGLRGSFLEVALAEPLARAPEAGAKGELLVRITQSVKETANFVGPLAGGADDAQGGGAFGAAGLDALQENAFELAAVLRTVGIDATSAAVEGGTRLRQVRRAQHRVQAADRQAQRLQPSGIITRL